MMHMIAFFKYRCYEGDPVDGWMTNNACACVNISFELVVHLQGVTHLKNLMQFRIIIKRFDERKDEM